MITSYSLFSEDSIPISNASASDELLCDFTIDMDGELTQIHAVALSELIALLNLISETTVIYGTDEYSFKLSSKSDYTFRWHRTTANSATHIVSIHSVDSKISEASLWTGHFHGAKALFYLKLMNEFLDSERTDLAKKYGYLFSGQELDTSYNYQTADKVKTVPNENVKTERIGYIIGKWYHNKEQSNMYYLMIDGEKYKKRYFEKDLERID